MSLLDDLSSEPTRHIGRPCGFGAWVATLTPEEAQAVRSAVRTMPDRRAARIFTDNGFPVSASTVANHRRDECASCRS